MNPKLSVLTITYKPGYIDTMVQALRSQTLPTACWEWVLVDDLWDRRHELVADYIGGSLNFKHLPSREIRSYSATASAINTGLAVAEGDLIYFMADYMYPHPGVLQRHWEIYQQHGPWVIISGPLVDAITIHGHSVWYDAKPWHGMVIVGGEPVMFKEFIPPVHVELTADIHNPLNENLLSIFRQPFQPGWPERIGLDWRMGHVTNEDAGPDLKRFSSPEAFLWWWCGRNDSAPLTLLRTVGGLEEQEQWRHGGLESIMAAKMMWLGAKYLVDRRAPCMILPHPFRKSEKP